MTKAPNPLQQRNIDQAAFSWICSYRLTHALTLTYPVAKPPAGELTWIDAKTGEITRIKPGLKSFSKSSTPLWTSSTSRTLRKNLRLLSAMVDDEVFGSNFREKQLSDRSFFFAFPSGTAVGHMLHVHMAWIVPENRFMTFENLFADGATDTPWAKITKAGTHKMDRIHDIGGWIRYCTKQSPLEQMIISQELVPEK